MKTYHVFQDMLNPEQVRVHYHCPCCDKSVIYTTTKNPTDDYHSITDLVCSECFDCMSEPA
jgi:hypothetical protein